MERNDRVSLGPQSQRSPAALRARARGARAMADLRPQSQAHHALQQRVQDGPAMAAQRQALQAAFGPAAQLRADAAQVAQLAGPEDELQMKAVAQLAAPEEELQMKAAPGAAQLVGEEDELQMKSAAQLAGPEDELQMKAAPAAVQLEEAPRNDTGLPDRLRAGIESLSGYSMDGVKVHYNSSQPAQLNALAYAQGTDIHVGPGQEQHLPHEAWHIVQQAQGRVQPTRQMKGSTPVNDDPGLEAEADRMGALAAGAAPAAQREER